MKTIIENEDGTIIIDNKVYKQVKDSAVPVMDNTKEATLLWMMKGLQPRHDHKTYQHSIFWFRQGEYMFEYDEKEKYFWCSYAHVWSVFEQKFNMDYAEIQSFICHQAELFFKRRGVKANFASVKFTTQVEKHFSGN